MRVLQRVVDLPSPQDLAWLSKADLAGPPFNSIPLAQVCEEVRIGKMQLWRFVPGPGVLLTEVIDAVSGMKRLNIVRAAGERISFGRRLALDLQHIAKEQGCAEVMTMVYEKRLAQAMRRVGAKAEAISMVLEVK